jgi:hypothetical protein
MPSVFETSKKFRGDNLAPYYAIPESASVEGATVAEYLQLTTTTAEPTTTTIEPTTTLAPTTTTAEPQA